MNNETTEVLPRSDEIADDSLDGRYAIKHFHGKTLAEAEQLFAQSLRECIPLAYTDDLLWMEPVGFRFYVRAAMRVALSECATGEPDFINGLAGSISWWHKKQPGELDSCAGLIADFCTKVFEDFDRYDADPDIYTGLREQYLELAGLFNRIADETENAQQITPPNAPGR